MSDNNKSKKALNLEEMLGLNVRADRVSIGAIDEKDRRNSINLTSVDWTIFAKLDVEFTETAVITDNDVEAIEMVSNKIAEANDDTKKMCINSLAVILSRVTSKDVVKQALVILESIFDFNTVIANRLISAESAATLSVVLVNLLSAINTMHSPTPQEEVPIVVAVQKPNDVDILHEEMKSSEHVTPDEQISEEPAEVAIMAEAVMHSFPVFEKKESTRSHIIRFAGFMCSVNGVSSTLREAFIDVVIATFKDFDKDVVDEEEYLLVIHALAMCLRYKPNRVMALEKSLLVMYFPSISVIYRLSNLFDVCVSNATQFVYLLLFSIWTFSFLPEALPLFHKKQCNLVGHVARSLNTYSSEKIIRMNVSIVQNLVKDSGLIEELIANGAIRRLNLLNQRIFKDTDISDMLRVVLDVLNTNYDILTSFDLYEKEIDSKHMHWGPRHTDEFWKENVRLFEKEDFKLIKSLISLLDSNDMETVSVACYDLGAFAIFYPSGKKIVSEMHGKEKVMALLSNSSEEVVNCALSACSRLMISKWEDLEKKNKK